MAVCKKNDRIETLTNIERRAATLDGKFIVAVIETGTELLASTDSWQGSVVAEGTFDDDDRYSVRLRDNEWRKL